MITCKLGGKEYFIDFVSGRALREIGEAERMHRRVMEISGAAIKGDEVKEGDMPSITEAMDAMVKWFCVLFGGQFTPDEVYDHYPVDCLMHDIAYAMMAVQAQMTQVLNSFPMNPTAKAKN